MLHHLGRLDVVVKDLLFFIGPIIIGLVTTRVSWLQGKGLDVTDLQIMKVVVIKVAGLHIK